ncbi:MAG: SH3 domain-containing protein [Nitrospinota bacterium]|nr:SH3 domain-containing protein [Nitrospinota bacterium]
MKRLLILSIISLSSYIASAADTLYVQSKSAKIMNSPSFKAETTGTLKRGDQLEVIEKGKGWYQVKTGDMTGWINQLNVSRNEPMERVSIITEATENLEDKSRRRASAVTSAAAARGLSEKDRKRRSDQEKADYNTLNRLENFTDKISDEEVEEFNKTGN